jgi:hypothetical protein
MDEQEFDALAGLRPFQNQDVKQFERIMALAGALWGAGPDHMQRQLLAPHPEIPAGYSLEDFRSLQRQSEALLSALQRKPLGPQWGFFRFFMDTKILVGSQSFTFQEACCEIVRRAIDFLEDGRESR